MARFLSPEWLDDLIAAADDRPGPDGALFTLQQIVTDERGGEVAWSVTVGEGSVAVAPGRHQTATITFTQDQATAAAIHHGELSAQAAFMTGRLRVGGDVRVLLERQDALASLDDIFASVRRATTYG
jgi:putative sterol carrier protein